MHFSQQVLDFYLHLPSDLNLPNGIETIYPFNKQETVRVMKLFFEKYYADTNPRTYIFGINPGRLGSGITGIGFCDANNLNKHCNIPNSFDKRSEISADFIFEVINAYGGVEKFYKQFYITSTFPMGLLKEQKNYNYYDDKTLQDALSGLILASIKTQMNFTQNNRDIICVGQGKNLKYLKSLNKEHKLFDTIHTVPHPRWVMQYKRKEKEKHIARYLEVFEKIQHG